MQKEVYEFISKQTGDPIIEWRTCAVSGNKFPIFQSDVDLLEKIGPSIGGKKIFLGLPSISPEERLRKKLMFRNERKLYRRKCDFSGKPIISIYAPESPYKVYDQKIRRSDDRDPMEYSLSIDWTIPFSKQFFRLLTNVPLPGVLNQRGENNEYCNHSADLENSYLSFGSANSQNCYYSYRAIDSEYIFDSSFINTSQYVYQSIDIENSYSIFFSQRCKDCSHGYYLDNCINCHHCMGCVNLQDASYCIYNKQYTKEKYEKILEQENEHISFDKVQQHVLSFPYKCSDNIGSENVIGNMIYNSQDIVNSFMIYDSHEIKYSQDMYHHTKTSMDCFSAYGPLDKAYDSIAIGVNGYGVYFSSAVHPASQVFYSMYCYGNNNLFGCVGLKNQQYCIFNKQYTKEKYEALVPKIIAKMQEDGERGAFFHPSLSPFGYNETVAQEYFPLIREEALARGYTWQDKEYPIDVPEGMATILGKDLPHTIEEVDDSILQKAIICEVSGRPFRIIKPELIFYRKHNLPLPRKHPDIRHQERLTKRPGRELFLRHCDKCGKEMLSVYKKEYEGRIYCEKCYQKEVYG